MAPSLNILIFHRIIEHESNDWTDVRLDLFKGLLTNAIKHQENALHTH